MNNEQRQFTIKCRNEIKEMKIALQWIERQFPACCWGSGSSLTGFTPHSDRKSNDMYFILFETEWGYRVYWNDEPSGDYDIHELSELIANEFYLPSKECLMDFLL